MLLRGILVELEKLFRRGRSYIAMVAILVILLLLEISMYMDGKNFLDFFTSNLQNDFFFQGNLLNGYLISYVALNTLWIHLPVLIVIVTGDLVSGEASSGTFRLLLTRPITRQTVIISKFISGLVYSAIVVLLLSVFSIGLGILLFGKGDLIVFIKVITILPEKELITRFLLAFGFGILSMWMVTALSFFFSVLSNNSLTPILYSIAVIILFTILTSFELGILNTIKPYLFTSHTSKWINFFEYQIDFAKIAQSVWILLGHIAVLFTLSIIIFNRKDITT